MIKTYDTSQAAFTERDSIKRYDSTAAAWVDVASAKTYDTTEAAWVERLKRYFELAVTSNFYNNSGNIALCMGDTFHVEVKPTSSTIEITASIEGDFNNPTIQAEYTFGNSDEVPAIASGFLSHACIDWVVRGYLNGSLVKTETIANAPAYEKVFNQAVTKVLSGTFDELRFVCVASSMSSYANYGKARTNLDNIRIDGKLYEGKSSIDSY